MLIPTGLVSALIDKNSLLRFASRRVLINSPRIVLITVASCTRSLDIVEIYYRAMECNGALPLFL